MLLKERIWWYLWVYFFPFLLVTRFQDIMVACLYTSTMVGMFGSRLEDSEYMLPINRSSSKGALVWHRAFSVDEEDWCLRLLLLIRCWKTHFFFLVRSSRCCSTTTINTTPAGNAFLGRAILVIAVADPRIELSCYFVFVTRVGNEIGWWLLFLFRFRFRVSQDPSTTYYGWSILFAMRATY